MWRVDNWMMERAPVRRMCMRPMTFESIIQSSLLWKKGKRDQVDVSRESAANFSEGMEKEQWPWQKIVLRKELWVSWPILLPIQSLWIIGLGKWIGNENMRTSNALLVSMACLVHTQMNSWKLYKWFKYDLCVFFKCSRSRLKVVWKDCNKRNLWILWGF